MMFVVVSLTSLSSLPTPSRHRSGSAIECHALALAQFRSPARPKARSRPSSCFLDQELALRDCLFVVICWTN